MRTSGCFTIEIPLDCFDRLARLLPQRRPGPRCLGAPAFGVPGCGGPRSEREAGDHRTRWLCARCAERTALRHKIAGPRQLQLDLAP